ncbi:MAG: ABC transporter ATP-binding protein [Elusimicrobia bacterium]|nr:ABC transporter ATP-binding protein [Elusimicrobiota bacterium]
MTKNSLRIENLTKFFSKHLVLDNLNIQISSGEIYGFLGPNKAGKTTTIKIAAGLILPSSGDVIINGNSITSSPVNAKKNIALIPDHPFLYPYMTPMDYIFFIASAYKLEKSVFKRALEYFELLSITSDASEVIESLSLGTIQKLVFIGAFIINPSILLIDEPMVGLDPVSARIIKDELKNMARNGTIVFVSTHILEMATSICTRIGIIHKGSLRAEGTIKELVKSTKTKNLEETLIKLTDESDYFDSSTEI